MRRKWYPQRSHLLYTLREIRFAHDTLGCPPTDPFPQLFFACACAPHSAFFFSWLMEQNWFMSCVELSWFVRVREYVRCIQDRPAWHFFFFLNLSHPLLCALSSFTSPLFFFFLSPLLFFPSSFPRFCDFQAQVCPLQRTMGLSIRCIIFLLSGFIFTFHLTHAAVIVLVHSSWHSVRRW